MAASFRRLILAINLDSVGEEEEEDDQLAGQRQTVSQSVSPIDFITEVCYVTNVTNAVREKTSSVFNVPHVQSSAKRIFLGFVIVGLL